LALILLVLTFHTFTSSVALPKYGLDSVQAQIVVSEANLANASDEQTHLRDFKPPKHSFVDYTTYFSPKHASPGYNPETFKLSMHEPLLMYPEVYLEIHVPPDNLA
jgi:hypothetical protein